MYIGLDLSLLGVAMRRGGIWTPAALGSSLALWLDANDASTITLNGSSVSQWSDKSGSGRHATQATATAQPTYTTAAAIGNRPVVRFDGNSDFLSIQQFETIAVFIVGSGGDVTNPQLSGAAPATFVPAWNVSNAGMQYRNSNDSTINTVTTSGSSQFNFGSAQIDLAQGRSQLSHLGSAETFFLHPLTSASGQVNTVGRDFAGVGQFFVGDIAEIVTINRLVTTAERQLMEGYLAWKWGLEANLPSDHPYRFSPPTVEEAGFDADALAYIGRVQSSDNAALEPTVRKAYNDFVVGCKADGIWNAIKSSAILAGARTLTGALQPLVGAAPTNFNFVSGDYNRKTGLVGDGNTKSLLANYTLLSTTANSTHFSYYQTQAPSASTAIIIGSWNENQTVDAVWDSGRLFLFSRDISYLSVAQTNGFIGHARSNNTTVTTRADGTSAVASSSIMSPQYDMLMRVFARNNIPNNAANFYSSARLAFYSIGESLDLALLDTRVTTLMNQINGAIP